MKSSTALAEPDPSDDPHEVIYSLQMNDEQVEALARGEVPETVREAAIGMLAWKSPQYPLNLRKDG